MDDIIARMKAEENELAFKLNAVRQFLAAYGQGPSARARTSEPQKPVRKTRSEDERKDKFGPYGQRIVEIADRLLPGCNANPIPTRTLVEMIEGTGVEITGNNKINSLSALLSRSSKMKGWGRAGWTRSAPEPGANRIQTTGGVSPNENGEAQASPDTEGAATPSYIGRRPIQLDDHSLPLPSGPTGGG